MPSKKRNPLAVIFLTIFIDLLGIGILIPVVPQLLANPSSPEYLLPPGMSLTQGYILLGILIASYPIAQFFATPILGQLSDRYGRLPILVFSLAGTAVGYLLFAMAILERNIPLLFLSRAIDGVTGGNISVAQAVIADVTTPENRAKNFGLMGAAFGIGFIIGPYIGGQLADHTIVSWFNAATPFWFAAILSVVNVVSILLLLPETNTRISRTPLRWDQSIRDIGKALSMPQLRTLFVVNFVYLSGFSFFTTFFGVYLIARFGFTESAIGNMFAYIGIWIAISQALLTPRISKRWHERQILDFTFIGTAVAVLLFLSPGPWTVMLLTVPLFSIVNGLTQANYMGFLSRSASEAKQGEVLGINASVSALSQALPPILSGFIAASAAPSATIIVACVIMVISGIIFIATIHRDPAGTIDPAMMHM